MLSFTSLTPSLIEELIQKFGTAFIKYDAETINNFSHDWTEDFHFPPAAVVFPTSTQEVSQIVKWCNENNIPITPAGACTGLSGGMLPVFGGIVLSTLRLNKILEIDTRNLQARVQPGVINEELQQAAAALGLYYPPDPSSKGSCTIGGNLAHNAGGIHAVKYGVTREYVLSLEAVMADGNIIRTGANVLKNSTGYSLTHLLIGSEGTLAVITEATLKLIPLPKYRLVLVASFPQAALACEAVSAIFSAGITPSALEFMERDAIVFGYQFLKLSDKIPDDVQAQLLIEIDGNYPDILQQEAQQIGEVLEKFQVSDILFADTPSAQNEVFKVRRCLGEAVKGTTIYKEEDTVVPRAELPRLLNKVKEIGKIYGFQSVCYGHAGDGNLHVNIIKTPELSQEQWEILIPKAIREIFQFTLALKGTLSGEHGIGYVQQPYMDIAFSEVEINLFKNIKKLWDPKGILNPGKMGNALKF